MDGDYANGLTGLIGSLPPMSFERFVEDILRSTGEIEDIQTQADVASIHADLVGYERAGHGRPPRIVVVEVKVSAVAGADLIRSEVERRQLLEKLGRPFRFILVVSGVLTASANMEAIRLGLEVWDRTKLAQLASPQVRQRWFGVAATAAPGAIGAHQAAKAGALRTALTNVTPGNDSALKYQKWVADLLEYIFVPPLGPVHYEDSDAAGRNRRDVILENWVPSGFWAQLRTTYQADQVVVDAKNFGAPVKKRSVLELAHYLKPYGCGLFGLIFSRQGAAPSAIHATREEWIGGRRLILILSDADALDMLALRERGGSPEAILQRKIGEFRKTL